MAQPITDYTAFFAEARQALAQREQLDRRIAELEGREKETGAALRAKQKAVSDKIAQTLKMRMDEISESYDTEIGKAQDQLKKVRAAREKARNRGVKERIAEDTQSLSQENSDLRSRIKHLFRANHVPGFCRSPYYYALYFTKGFREAGIFFLTVFLCFLAVPCAAYLLIPERKTWYLILIYVLVILIFGGLYVTIGNMTKLRYMDVLKEGRRLCDQIKANKKQIRVIVRSIRRDKNDAIYNLQKFDDEIAQLDQDLSLTFKKKSDALNTFETVTKTIISDEIMGGCQNELDGLTAELEAVSEELKRLRAERKEKSLFLTDHYEIYTGKEFMTEERLTALEEIIQDKAASNISEAITIYRGRNSIGTNQ